MSQIIIDENQLARYRVIALIASEGGLEAFASRTLALAERTEKPVEKLVEKPPEGSQPVAVDSPPKEFAK